MFPVNDVDPIKTSVSGVYDASLRGLKIESTAHGFLEDWYVQIVVVGGEILGFFKIINVIDANNFVIDYFTSVTYTDNLLIQRYYKGYKALVKVFVGAPEYHPYNTDGSKPQKEIGIIEVDFNAENEGIANVRSFVKPDLAAKFDNVAGVPDAYYQNSHHLWTGFAIEYAEIWEGNETPVFNEDILDDCSTFTGFTNPSFDDGLNNWSQDNNGITWTASAGQADINSPGGVGNYQSNILYQNIALQANIEYDISMSYDLLNVTLSDNVNILIIAKYEGLTVSIIHQRAVTKRGSGNVSFKFFPSNKVEYIGLVVQTANATPSSWDFDCRYFQVSTDALDQCKYSSFALLGTKQFQDTLGGNFGDYVLNRSNKGKFLTHFEELRYPFNINALIPANTFAQSIGGDSVFLEIYLLDGSGNVVEYVKQKVLSLSDGVYTIEPEITADACDWVRGYARLISTPNNIFLDGDNGTFEDGTPANWNISSLDAVATGVSAITQNPRSGTYAGSFQTSAPNAVKGEYELYRFDTPLNVQSGLFYNFESWYYYSGNYSPSLNQKANLYFKLEGTNITSNKIFLDTNTLPQVYEYVPLTINLEATQDSYNVILCIEILEDIVGSGSGGFVFDDISLRGPVEYLSEDKLLNSKCECGYELEMRWLNDLGGWDIWNFTQWKTINEEVTEKTDIRRDITANWDNNFIDGDTEFDAIFIESRKAITVRSQSLTKSELYALGMIQRSIKPQAKIGGKWVTVSIEKGSFLVSDEQAKTQEISFVMKLPTTLIQEQ